MLLKRVSDLKSKTGNDPPQKKNQRGAGNNKIFFSTKLYSVGGKKVDWGPIDLVQSTLKH